MVKLVDVMQMSIQFLFRLCDIPTYKTTVPTSTPAPPLPHRLTSRDKTATDNGESVSLSSISELKESIASENDFFF